MKADVFTVVFFFGVVAICVALMAFVSDLVIDVWRRWDRQRRCDRLDDVAEMKRLLELEEAS